MTRLTLKLRHRSPLRRLPPAGPASYLAHAEACLAQAAVTPDATPRALHEEECTLWLMLARQRSAIDAVLQSYIRDVDAAA